MKHNVSHARLKEIYYSVFASAGSDHPKLQKYHTCCFASHLPPLHKQWDAQPYLRTALNTTKASFNARFRSLSSHHFACETGTWRRRNGPAGLNPTRSTRVILGAARLTRLPVVQDEQHVCFSCAFKACRPKSPCSLIRTAGSPQLCRTFNEYEVTYEDIAWFLKETQLMYTMR
jgi:hypothetical protein